MLVTPVSLKGCPGQGLQSTGALLSSACDCNKALWHVNALPGTAQCPQQVHVNWPRHKTMAVTLQDSPCGREGHNRAPAETTYLHMPMLVHAKISMQAHHARGHGQHPRPPSPNKESSKEICAPPRSATCGACRPASPSRAAAAARGCLRSSAPPSCELLGSLPGQQPRLGV